MNDVFFGAPRQTVTLSMDNYEHAIPSGRFFGGDEQETHPFHGLMELLISLDRWLDEQEGPQAAQEPRSFVPVQLTKKAKTLLPAAEKKGVLATFTVKFLFRQNSSWQGSVYWNEGQKEQPFRSALELTHLIYDILEEPKAD